MLVSDGWHEEAKANPSESASDQPGYDAAS